MPDSCCETLKGLVPVSEPPPIVEMDDEGWLIREGVRWREARYSCPPPDLLVVRSSELLDPALRDTLALHASQCEACARLARDLEALSAESGLDAIEARVLARVREQSTGARRWRWSGPVAAAMLLACVMGITWWMGAPVPRGTSALDVLANRPPVRDETTSEVAADWTIEAAPVRLPMSSLGALRSSGDATSDWLMEALAPYQAGRFDEAIPLLEAAAQSHRDSADAAFYLGVARLLAGRARDAIAPLEHAATLSSGSRRVETEWYLATAEQRSGSTAAARTRLAVLCQTAGDYQARACAAAHALQ